MTQLHSWSFLAVVLSCRLLVLLCYYSQPVRCMSNEEHLFLFQQAVDAKNEAAMMALMLRKNPLPVLRNDLSILHYCVLMDRPEYLRKYLTITPKPDLNPRTDDGLTPLMAAFFGGNAQIIDSLLDQVGLDVHAVVQDDGFSTLMYAAAPSTLPEQFKRFLAYSKDTPLDVNYEDASGYSALLNLVGYEDNLALLLQYAQGKLELPSFERVRVLLIHLEIYRSLDQFVNIWRHMKLSNRIALLQGSEEEMSILCIEPHTNVAIWEEWLLQTPGVDVNVRCNVEGAVPNSTPLMLLVQKGRRAEARLMLSNRDIQVNLQDQNGFTTLMYATISLHPKSRDLVQDLLNRRDIDVNVTNPNGFTALMYATLKYPQDEAKFLVGIFLSHPDITVELRNKDGQTAMDLAMGLRHVGLMNLYKRHFFRPILFFAKGEIIKDRLPYDVIKHEVEVFVAMYAPTYADALVKEIMKAAGKAKPKRRTFQNVESLGA